MNDDDEENDDFFIDIKEYSMEPKPKQSEIDIQATDAIQYKMTIMSSTNQGNSDSISLSNTETRCEICNFVFLDLGDINKCN